MTRSAPLLPLVALLACANPAENEDAGVPRDGGGAARDGGVEAPRDGGEVERDGGTVERDGGEVERDGGTVEQVVDVKVAYTIVAADGLTELWVTESSTTSHKINPPLAGGPTVGGKGETITSGVFGFDWIRYGEAIVYEAQQDTFDRRELYFVLTFGDQPDSTTYKQSRSDADGPTLGFGVFPTGQWIYFYQRNQNQTNLYIMRSGTSTVSQRLNRGQPANLSVSRADYVAFQDIVVGGGGDDRDLWIASPSTPPYRVNPGANVGFGGSKSWAPNGREIAYIADENESRVFELYRHDVNTGPNGPRELMHPRLPSTADVVVGRESVEYSPANTHLAYIADADTDQLVELYEIDLTQPAPRTQFKINPAFAAGQTGVDRFSYSPDGAFIAYAADLAAPDLDELYVARSATQEAVRLHPAVAAGDRVFGERWLDASRIAFLVTSSGTTRAFVADLSTFPPAAPTELSSPVIQFGDANRSFSGRYLVYLDDASPRSLWLTDLMASPLTQTMIVDSAAGWCWSERDELAVISRRDDPTTPQLYVIQDVQRPTPIGVGPPLPDGSRVGACKFAPKPE